MQGRAALAAGCGALTAITTADVVFHGPLRHLDATLAQHYFNDRIAHIGTTSHIADVFSQVGQPWISCVIVGSLALLIAAKSRRFGPVVAAVVGLATVGLSTWILKHLIAYPSIFFHRPGSFPSGHTSVAAVSSGLVVWFLLGSSPRRDASAIAAGAAWGAAMGWSRVVLPAHWLSDVVAGWALGMLALLLAFAAADGGWARRRQPVPPQTRS